MKISAGWIFTGVIIAFFSFMFWFDSIPPTPEQEAAHAERVVDRLSADMQDSLRYAKDTTTGYCFAIAWRGAGNGGPMMAHVPCPTEDVSAISVFQSQ